MICVEDNGCGMNKRQLNDWAVMNLSMHDRGIQPAEPEAPSRGAQGRGHGAGRFLSSELSFFGVGSKNAAFFLGCSIKIATRTRGSPLVHELAIRSAELEQRYRDGQAVYEEDILHRRPGDASTLSSEERKMPLLARWVAEEAGSAGDGGDDGAEGVVSGRRGDGEVLRGGQGGQLYQHRYGARCWPGDDAGGAQAGAIGSDATRRGRLAGQECSAMRQEI